MCKIGLNFGRNFVLAAVPRVIMGEKLVSHHIDGLVSTSRPHPGSPSHLPHPEQLVFPAAVDWSKSLVFLDVSTAS